MKTTRNLHAILLSYKAGLIEFLNESNVIGLEIIKSAPASLAIFLIFEEA